MLLQKRRYILPTHFMLYAKLNMDKAFRKLTMKHIALNTAP